MSESLIEAAPPMPDGFTDRAAWDAIHWRFSDKGSLLDEAVIGWQRDNQERVKAAAEVAALKTCPVCDRDLHGYVGPLCCYCDGTAE